MNCDILVFATLAVRLMPLETVIFNNEIHPAQKPFTANIDDKFLATDILVGSMSDARAKVGKAGTKFATTFNQERFSAYSEQGMQIISSDPVNPEQWVLTLLKVPSAQRQDQTLIKLRF